MKFNLKNYTFVNQFEINTNIQLWDYLLCKLKPCGGEVSFTKIGGYYDIWCPRVHSIIL